MKVGGFTLLDVPTRMVSFLVMHKVPYTVTQPCGGWLLWTTCTVTLYKMIPRTENKTVMEQVTKCCDGYVQVGRYCALSVNRSGELIAKPGSCPTADGLHPTSEDCEWDMDCPGWQKCCQRLGHPRCNHPASQYTFLIDCQINRNGVTDKYFSSKGDSVQFLSLFSYCRDFALQCVTVQMPFQAGLYMCIVIQVQPIDMSVFADVDECVEPALHQCSAQADCNNTVGSYQCSCRQGYIDVDPTPPNITALTSSNVTGTSFCVYWSSQFLTNQTYRVVLSNGSQVIRSWETNQTMIEVRRLEPGVLYIVTITPCACGIQGDTLRISVKTDAQTLDATARLTNVNFTADLQNSSSQAYKNLTASIIEEVSTLQGLSSDRLYRISHKAYFIVSSTQASRFKVQKNKIKTQSQYIFLFVDFNECTSGENDCSQWASCSNTWASYTCECLDRFIDNNPERPGRACQGRDSFSNATLETMTPSPTPTIYSTVSTTSFSLMTPSTSDPALTTGTTTPGITKVIISTSEMVSTASTPTTTPAIPTTTTAIPTTTTAIPTTTTAIPTTTTAAPTTTPAIPTTTTAAPITTTAAPTTASTIPITTTAIPTPTTAAQKTTTAAPTTMAAAPTTTNAASTTTTTIPTTTNAAPITTTAAPITTTAAPTTTTAALTTTTAAPTTITTTATTTTNTPTTATTALTLTPATTVTKPTTTAIAPTRNATALRTMSVLGVISVQCRVAATTVTVARDFLLNSKIRESTLYLGLQDCGVNGGNGTHAQLTVAWNECATMLVQVTESMAECILFPPIPRYDMIKDVIAGLGSFQVTVQLMNGTVPLPHNYSLSAEEAVVVDVSLNTSSEQIKVVIDRCWATPTMNPADSHSYTFLENSCSLNAYTKVLMNGTSSTSRLSVQIFSFVNLDVIYLHCQVYICVQIGSDTCVPVSTSYSEKGKERAADTLEQEYDTVHIIGFSCLGVGLLLFFVVAFICLFYYQRNRIGHYNFTVKPKQENFTYLVFNT
uniref:Uromodulin-like 1 n=1 Tax=Scophthalmus maximus TaxID=52904 RepID=A0A8D2ZH90_SCOMX